MFIDHTRLNVCSNKFIFQSTSEETAFEAKLKNSNSISQPRCFIFGPFENCKGCVVTITTKYYYDNPIEAVSTCFKVYQALNSIYPRESSHVWEFLQKSVYKITTNFDKNYDSVTRLLNQIENLKLQN